MLGLLKWRPNERWFKPKPALTLVPKPGDALSASQASSFLSCPARWKYDKIDRLPKVQSGAASLGTCVDRALSANFAQKIETGEDLPAEDVVAIYREAWEVRANETEFADDESPTAMQRTGEELAVKYLAEIAPAIQPAAVQQRVEGKINGVHVVGFFDLRDVDGCIIDLKTAKAKPSGISADYRFQVATYAQLDPQCSGAVRVDTMVKTKTPQIVTQSFTIDEADVKLTNSLYPQLQQLMRTGPYLPNRGSYLCSRKYCSFWRACTAEYGGKVE